LEKISEVCNVGVGVSNFYTEQFVCMLTLMDFEIRLPQDILHTPSWSIQFFLLKKPIAAIL